MNRFIDMLLLLQVIAEKCVLKTACTFIALFVVLVAMTAGCFTAFWAIDTYVWHL